MQIYIDGYKNLKDFNIDITDNRINIFFGMSGSGKSAVGEALTKQDIEFNTTVNRKENPLIKVNDKDTLPDISVFDIRSVEDLLMTEDSNSIYDVVVDDGRKLRKAEKNLKEYLSTLKDSIRNEEILFEQLNTIKTALGSATTKNKELKKNAKICKISRSISTSSDSETLKQIQSLPSGKYTWLIQGKSFISSNECPFCGKPLSSELNDNLSKLEKFEAKSLHNMSEVIDGNPAYFNDFDYSRKAVENMQETIRQMSVACDGFQKIKEKVADIEGKAAISIAEIDFPTTEEFYRFFPSTYGAVYELKQRIVSFNNAVKGAKENTKNILKRQISPFNEILKQMSIPYELSAEYANGRINNYKLMHVDDKERIDRRKSLSQGEKCIIALVMFILKCKKSKSELFVIDDPASAFDDYRKSQIFQLVESRLSGKTVLLFSHDPVFAKYAVISKKKGRIVYFRKGINGTEFTDIDRDDFGIFEDFIKDKILNCTDYYRVLVNLRLLYEGGRGPVYKYLSAIIHRTPKTDIDRLLDEEGITEAAVFLKMIEKHSWLRGKLRGFMDSINPINPSQWSLMEKAFLIREAYEKEVEEAGLKNELNEFVHINKKLRVCLDPYRFNLCSKELEGFLENIDLDNYYSGSNALIQPMRE